MNRLIFKIFIKLIFFYSIKHLLCKARILIINIFFLGIDKEAKLRRIRTQIEQYHVKSLIVINAIVI